MTLSPDLAAAHRWTEVDAFDLIGTPADRAALFDHILSATLRRQAEAPAKRASFGLDLRRDMERLKERLVTARSPAEVWYALNVLSNTRHDRHLRVEPVPGGLPVPPDLIACSLRGYVDPAACTAPEAPVRLATDFSGPEPRLFLAGIAVGTTAPAGIREGQWLSSVNGVPAGEFIASFRPWHCHSTPEFFWYHLPRHLTRQGAEVPDGFWSDRLELGFSDGGAEIRWQMDYAPAGSHTFAGTDPRYTGWTPGPATDSFRAFLQPEQKVLALEWLGFGAGLVADCDLLTGWAAENRLLDHALIFDATLCRGGDYGGYLLQCLFDRPFRINKGDLRLSDAIPGVIRDVLAEDAQMLARGDRSAAQIAAMGWRRDWLEGDVMAALRTGLDVTPPVPFKCAHQPKDGDAILPPAPVHFRGKMVALSLPFGGSHIDQVMAQLHDNGRCLQIGLPIGGFSKTWVGTEVLRLPDGTPLAEFQWSCGNTIRPNGEVLEGNPARPHIAVPPTRENHAGHHALLLETALGLLARDLAVPATTAPPLNPPLEPAEFRTLFPALRHQTYLSICDKTILADPVRLAVDGFLDRLAGASANRTDHEELVEGSRNGFARLVNAGSDEIAVLRNVSDGVNSIAAAFPFREGDNVVLGLGAEHPNNTYPWLRLARRGVQLRDIPAPGGVIDIEALMAAADAATRIITVASVSFAPGGRTDLVRLGEFCRSRDILLLVDGVQTAGILHHDFAAEPVDAFATSTSKGLLGLYGYGFLYLRRHWAERLEPAFLSRTGVMAEAGDGHSSMGGHDYRLRPGAGRFELGSYNLAGAYAANCSIRLLERIGTRRIEAHVLDLAARLREGLKAQGLPVYLPGPGAASHLVTVGAVDAGGHGFSTDPAITALAARLSAASVVMTVRRGQLRFGLHAFNSDADIRRVLELTAAGA